MSERMIGARIPRKEDFRLTTGRGRFTDDIDRPGQAQAFFVRSPHAHARIRAIATAAAEAAPGVVAVLTGADLDADGIGDIGVYTGHAFGKESKRQAVLPRRRPLNWQTVRYVGDPFAVVIAETRDQAKDAAELIEVDFEPLPALANVVQADTNGAVQIWPEAPENICIEHEFGDQAAAEAAFAKAAHIASLELVNNRVVSNPMEPRVAVGEYDEFEEQFTLYTATQNPHMIQIMMAEDCFHVPARRIRVVSYDVGGGYGTRAMLYSEEVVLVWAAKRVGRPVKWTGERAEIFLSDAHGRDHVSRCEMALDADGRFLGLRLHVLANIGGYVSTLGLAVPVMHQSILSGGTYDIPAIFGNVRAVFTNTVPLDAYRGAGRPETAYMIERLVDCAAHDLGMDKAEIRRRNLIRPDDMPYRSPLGLLYADSDFPDVLRRALEIADYESFPARRAEARARGKLRGIGVSSYVEVTGWAPSDINDGFQRFGAYETAEIRFDPEGGVTLYTGTHANGQGHETTFAQLVSDGLGIPMDDIRLVHGDTEIIAFGRGTAGSRSLIAGGAAFRIAMDKIIVKGKKMAAHILEAAAADIEFAEGKFTVAGTDRHVTMKAIAEAAYFPAGYPSGEIEPGLEETGYWDPLAPNFPNGCQVCELEIDPDTGAVEVLRYSSVDDFGRVINPMIVEGQVHGGIVQGLGQALLENCHYEPESGQLLTGSFQDYCMPRADNLPNFDTAEAGVLCSTNPLGVKGCGESGTVGATPAVSNAVADALAPLGVRHVDMPHTPETVWRAIRAARGA